MRRVELACEVNMSKSTFSRRYHIQEAMVIGMRRLMASAIEGELISISLSGALGAQMTSKPPAPPAKWEPREEDTGYSTLLDV